MATSRKSVRKGTKAKSRPSSSFQPGPVPPYGVPIREAIARGDASEMKRVAADARKYLRDVQAALDKLDAALGYGKGR